MRHVLTIALNDLLISVKERETFLVGLLMPAVMIMLLGLAQTGAGEGPSIFIDVIDEDGSALSQQFVELLRQQTTGDNTAFAVCPYHGDAADGCGLDANLSNRPADWRSTADDRLEKTAAFGTIIIEPGFGDALRAGEPVTIFLKRSGELSAPTLAEQAIESAISRMGGSVAIANLAISVAEQELSAFAPGDPAQAAVFDAVLAEAEAAWQNEPIRVVQQGTKADPATNGFNQSGPGTATMFVFMFTISAATLLLTEREQGTLQRLYTLPLRRWQIIAGKLLGRYVFGLAQFTILALVGMGMGVKWGSNLAGLALVILVFTLASTALGLALATIIRTSAQANSAVMLLGLTLAPLGGAWWPLELVPDFMKTIGHISPIAWAMDAFHEMMYYGGGVIDILPMMGVLLGMTAVFFAFGVFNLKYE